VAFFHIYANVIVEKKNPPPFFFAGLERRAETQKRRNANRGREKEPRGKWGRKKKKKETWEKRETRRERKNCIRKAQEETKT
jgi:hypothetical protein